ncbi:hypothetical protein LP417_26580 [Polaromonas sp. P1-6]|nr:hypothetical protein LP417_26580 [Polaromonas sp. P1-6]
MMERLLMVIAAATVATAARSDDAAVRATLQRAFPQSPIQGISKTPVPGVLEAAIEGQVFYITADGRYILGGPLLDAKGTATSPKSGSNRSMRFPSTVFPSIGPSSGSRAPVRAGSPSSRIPTVPTARRWSRRLRASTT